MTDQPVVSLAGVEKDFALPGGLTITALTGINLDLRRGEFVSLIGPSGCGKSTLLRLIGDLTQPTAGTVTVNLNYNDVGTAMLQDAVWARASWLAESNNEDVAVRFLRASFKGWIYCRDKPADCEQFVVDNGSTLGAGHQKWMMNEINALIWPSPAGVGMLDADLWSQTVDTALEAGIITAAPAAASYRTDLAAKALEGLSDATGTGWTKATVAITPGGE